MNILFVCKHNRFRSKVAETLFKEYNKNKNIKVESAGTSPDYIPVADNVKKAILEFVMKIINDKPKKITKTMIKRADLIVIVADDVKQKFPGKKVIIWKISDISEDDYMGIFNRVLKIREKVKALVRKLNKYKRV